MKTKTITKLIIAAIAIILLPGLLFNVLKYGIEDKPAITIMAVYVSFTIIACHIAIEALSKYQKEQEQTGNNKPVNRYNLDDIDNISLISVIITKKFYGQISKALQAEHRHEVDQFIKDISVKFFLMEKNNSIKTTYGKDKVLSLHQYTREEIHQIYKSK